MPLFLFQLEKIHKKYKKEKGKGEENDGRERRRERGRVEVPLSHGGVTLFCKN